MVEEMNDVNEDKQKQRIKIKKLPLVSFASGLFSAVLFFLLGNHGFVTWLMDLYRVYEAIFWVICGLIIPVIGIVCGLYYLITVKTWHPLERVCAILGILMLEFWLCVLWFEVGLNVFAPLAEILRYIF